MIPKLQALADQWDRDARAYLANAPITPGSPAKDITQLQQNSVNQAGLLRLCAEDLRKLIKKHETLHTTPSTTSRLPEQTGGSHPPPGPGTIPT